MDSQDGMRRQDQWRCRGLLTLTAMRAMVDRLGHEEKALHRAVGEVLHYIWDPIGVAGSVQARDEYDGYIDHVCRLLWQGADAVKISQHLVKLAEQNMGIPNTQALADLATLKLLEWRDALT